VEKGEREMENGKWGFGGLETWGLGVAKLK